MAGLISAGSVLILAIVIGLLYPAGQVAWRVRNERSRIQALGADSCQRLPDPLLNGCEKGVIHHQTGQVFFACAVDLTIRDRWFPPTGNLDKKAALSPKGAIIVLDLHTLKTTRLSLIGFPASFHTHGLSVIPSDDDEDEVFIGAVNHAVDGSRIEIFSHKLRSHTAKHLETFRDDANLFAPNDVQLVDRHSFYATNDRGSYSSFSRVMVERTGWLSKSHVVYKGPDGKVKIAFQGLHYANGITFGLHAKQLYVADTFEGRVTKYERKPNNRLRLIDHIVIPHYVDNISVEPTTGDIYVAGITNYLACFYEHFRGRTNCAGAVTKLTNNTDADIFFGKKYKTTPVFADDSRRIGILSWAGVDRGTKKSVAGGVAGGVVVCNSVW